MTDAGYVIAGWAGTFVVLGVYVASVLRRIRRAEHLEAQLVEVRGDQR
ncbi:MAG: hypothetical protein ACOYNI_03865 [Acidimicrobiia bacterium]